MDAKQHYLIMSSADSQDIHPFNRPSDFTVELPHTLHLLGRWECALTAIQSSKSQSDRSCGLVVYICSDLCEESYVGNKQIPILRSIAVAQEDDRLNTDFARPYYMLIKRDQVKRIHIFVISASGGRLTFLDEHLTCTLHLRRRA